MPRPPADDDTPDTGPGDSTVYRFGRALAGLLGGSETAREFEQAFENIAGEPSSGHDASFFAGVGIAEQALAQRKAVASSNRDADPDENTVPAVRVSQVRDGEDGPVQAITVTCSDPDTRFALRENTLEVHSPAHDYTDPVRVPFASAVLEVADVSEISEATVIDKAALPDDYPADVGRDGIDSGIDERDPGEWAADDAGDDPHTEDDE